MVEGRSASVIKLEEILYSEKLSENLLSFGKMVDQGFDILLTDSNCYVYQKNSNLTVLKGVRRNKFWYFDFKILDPKTCLKRKILAMNTISTDQSSNRNNPQLKSDRKISDSSDSDYSDTDSTSRKRKRKIVRESNSKRLAGGESMDSVCDNELLMKLDLSDRIKLDDLEKLKFQKSESIRKKIGFLLHVCLGHPSLGYLKQLGKTFDWIKGVNFGDEILDCEVCQLAKIKKQPHKSVHERAKKPLEIVHSDLVGPLPTPGIFSSSKHIVTFIDDWSRYAIVYTLSDKTCVNIALRDYLTSVRSILNNPSVRVNCMRIDGGTEYLTQEMRLACKNENIVYDTAPADTAPLNGTAERYNLSLIETVKALLLDSGLPIEFWELAAQHACNLRNRLPHKSIDMKTPFELFHGKTFDIQFLKRFGSVPYRCIPQLKSTTQKLEPSGDRGIYLGNYLNSYIILLPERRVIREASNVVITESVVF